MLKNNGISKILISYSKVPNRSSLQTGLFTVAKSTCQIGSFVHAGHGNLLHMSLDLWSSWCHWGLFFCRYGLVWKMATSTEFWRQRWEHRGLVQPWRHFGKWRTLHCNAWSPRASTGPQWQWWSRNCTRQWALRRPPLPWSHMVSLTSQVAQRARCPGS
jgi:hypothetical protein